MIMIAHNLHSSIFSSASLTTLWLPFNNHEIILTVCRLCVWKSVNYNVYPNLAQGLPDRDRLPIPIFLDFPGGSAGKESAWNSGDLDLIPGLRRSPGAGHGNPLQYNCLENPHGQKSLVDYRPWRHKELNTTESLSTAQYSSKSRWLKYIGHAISLKIIKIGRNETKQIFKIRKIWK